ncbi:MAG: hypothetical protein KKG99_02305 [Bacteroidetes bacterium]|nr:hypothetical protein [Bacteroidota bacterium]
MKTKNLFKIILSSICIIILMISCSEKAVVVSENEIAKKIIAMEKAALDRWGNRCSCAPHLCRSAPGCAFACCLKNKAI